MPRFEIRVSLPDRPGALGSLASAVGAAGFDIVEVHVMGADDLGNAVDDLVVDAPTGSRDELLGLVEAVEGAVVERIRAVAQRPGDRREPLDAAVEVVMAAPDERVATLTAAVPHVFAADWAVAIALGDEERLTQLGASSAARSIAGLRTPWMPLSAGRRLEPGPWIPSQWGVSESGSIVVVPLGTEREALMLIRARGPRFRLRETRDLENLARIATMGVSSNMPG